MTSALHTLIDRYDPGVLDVPSRGARVRLEVAGDGHHDVVVDPGGARLVEADGAPQALLRADAATWEAIARDLRGGMDAYRSGRLTVRHNVHLGVGLLAATSGMTQPGRLEFKSLRTQAGRRSVLPAGAGGPGGAPHGPGGAQGAVLPPPPAPADRV